jgi:CelD/BcsL family acetyltransferase involved in cellulose biosynthesis
MLECAEIAGARYDDSLRREWNALLEEAGPGLGLFTPEWYEGWAATAREEGAWTDFRTLVARDRAGRLCGVLPLARRRAGPLRIWAFAGSWQPWRTIVARPADEEPVGRAFGEWLARTAWEAIRIGPVRRAAAGTRALLAALGAKRVPVWRRSSADLCVFSGTCDLATYRDEVVGKKTLKTYEYKERRLAKAGKLEIVRVTDASGPRLERLLDDLATIESRSWLVRRGGKLRFVPPRQRRLWARLVETTLGPRGQLDCWMMYLDDRPISFVFALTAGSVRYFIANNYDEAYEKHSPGSILYRHVNEDGIRRGIRTFDFGDGDLHYKSVWGAQAVTSLDVHFAFPSRVTAAALGVVRRAAPPLERARDRALALRARGRSWLGRLDSTSREPPEPAGRPAT